MVVHEAGAFVPTGEATVHAANATVQQAKTTVLQANAIFREAKYRADRRARPCSRRMRSRMKPNASVQQANAIAQADDRYEFIQQVVGWRNGIKNPVVETSYVDEYGEPTTAGGISNSCIGADGEADWQIQR